MHAKAPGSIVFTEEELERMHLAQVALLVHKFQSEVAAQPYRDMMDLLHIDKANKEIEAERAAKRAKAAKRKRK